MRRLMLFRHSKAARPESRVRDHDRVLDERGRADAEKLGLYMARHALLPDMVVVSTAARTQETWTLAGAAFRPAPKTRSEARLYDASAEAIVDVIKEAPAGVKTLLLVGHNPGLHEVALMLVATGDIDVREQLHEKFPTSGLAVIDFAVESWSMLHPYAGRLERFIGPKTLEAVTR